MAKHKLLVSITFLALFNTVAHTASPIASHWSTLHDANSTTDETTELFTQVRSTHRASHSITVRQKHVENVCGGLDSRTLSKTPTPLLTAFTPDSLAEQRRNFFSEFYSNHYRLKKYKTIKSNLHPETPNITALTCVQHLSVPHQILLTHNERKFFSKIENADFPGRRRPSRHPRQYTDELLSQSVPTFNCATAKCNAFDYLVPL